MYKVNVDNKFNFNFEKAQGVWQLAGKDIAFDMIEINQRTFHVLKDNKSYNVEIVNHNVAEKTLYDALLHELGLDKAMSKKVSNIKAPMPGMVLNILVEEGQDIKKGDALIILEAMKMENILKSPADGKVKKVAVKKGIAVEKGQILIEF